MRYCRKNGATDVFISDLATSRADPDADRLQRLHDHRVVLAPALQDDTLFTVILISWGLAFVEYCFAVPANRWGHAVYSAAELKTMQEVITLSVFAAFSVLYLGERITLNHLVGFALICAGAFFVFKGPLPS